MDFESGEYSSADKVKAGTAVFLIELEKRRAIKAGDYNIIDRFFMLRYDDFNEAFY